MKPLLIAAALATALTPVPMLAVQSAAEQAAPTRFSVGVVGEGSRDVILIPGLLSPRSVWDDHVEALAADNRVHLVEVAGFGDTEAGPNAQGEILPALLLELADYIEANDLNEVSLVGHSMGGFASLNLALDRPDLVDRVLIVDSLPFFSAIMGMEDAEAARPQADRMRAMMVGQADAERPAPDCASPSLQAQGMAKSPAGQCKVDAYSLTADMRVGGQLFYELMTGDVRARLADLDVPVTLLFPYDAPALPLETADGIYRGQYAAAGDRITFVPVADSRHFIMFDQPEALAAALENFLAD